MDMPVYALVLIGLVVVVVLAMAGFRLHSSRQKKRALRMYERQYRQRQYQRDLPQDY